MIFIHLLLAVLQLAWILAYKFYVNTSELLYNICLQLSFWKDLFIFLMWPQDRNLPEPENNGSVSSLWLRIQNLQWLVKMFNQCPSCYRFEDIFMKHELVEFLWRFQKPLRSDKGLHLSVLDYSVNFFLNQLVRLPKQLFFFSPLCWVEPQCFSCLQSVKQKLGEILCLESLPGH